MELFKLLCDTNAAAIFTIFIWQFDDKSSLIIVVISLHQFIVFSIAFYCCDGILGFSVPLPEPGVGQVLGDGIQVGYEPCCFVFGRPWDVWPRDFSPLSALGLLALEFPTSEKEQTR